MHASFKQTVMAVSMILLVVLLNIFCLSDAQRFRSLGSVVLGKYGEILLVAFNFSSYIFVVSFKAPVNANYTKTYYLSAMSLKADPMGAFSFCRNNGMTLVTLDGPDEFNFFFGLCIAHTNSLDPNTWNIFHIGSVAIANNSKTGYVWFSTGQAIGTIPWAPTEPNNANGVIENCLAVQFQDTGKMGVIDIPCNSPIYQFVCQDSTLKGKGDVPVSSG